jgi:phosphate transport system substrate-binding protein
VNVSIAMRAAAVTAIAALGLAACGSSSGGGSGSGTTLTPQGSTFQETLQQQWASQYHQMHSSAKITYTGTGSSAGIAQFTAGKIAFAGSDVTMTSQEQSQANSSCGSQAWTVPITSGGVAIMYNVPGVSTLKMSAATVAGIFMGKITHWNDSQIAAENPGVNLPSIPISVFHRADGSGTTAVLSGFLDATAPSVWTLGVDKQFSNWPTGQGATGSSGVAQGVKNTQGGITYAEVTYAKQDSLATAAIKGATGGYVPITPSEVAKSIQSGFTITGSGHDLAGSLTFTKMTGYPISTVSYVLVCSKYKNSSEGSLVNSYLTYAAGPGQSQATALGFAPLPSQLASKASASVSAIT